MRPSEVAMFCKEDLLYRAAAVNLVLFLVVILFVLAGFGL
jgi:hypothetical protein